MDYPIKTVCVVGLGYIGLPTAATLASRGIDVIGVDINPRVVEAVNAGHKLALWRREEKREDNSQKRGKREAHGRCRTQ